MAMPPSFPPIPPYYDLLAQELTEAYKTVLRERHVGQKIEAASKPPAPELKPHEQRVFDELLSLACNDLDLVREALSLYKDLDDIKQHIWKQRRPQT